MKRMSACVLSLVAFCAIAAPRANAQITKLLATGQLISSRAGSYADLSGLNYSLESGVPANHLGGLGSGLAYVSGNTFLALPDRGPNVLTYNPAVDNTVSYIDRFHTVTMNLQPNTGAGLPFTLTPELRSTTLLHALLPLAYGDGKAFGLPPGAPPFNGFLRHYFTGRSDNFDPRFSSADPFDARLDPESIRVSNDGLFVYISDEYGPYVYEFLRATGERVRSFELPAEFFVAHPEPIGTACPPPPQACSNEQVDNASGRVPNKGMEGLAITPDGKTLVGILQAPTIQDVKENPNSVLLRGVVIDIASGRTLKEFAYLLTTGSGVSDLVAINDHEFLVDERDGKGLGDGSKAKVKQFFKIDLANAVDIEGMHEGVAVSFAVPKSAKPLLDLVAVLGANGVTSDKVPSKIEGTAFGPDVTYQGVKMHTLWIGNDNDFDEADSGPNVFYVLGFTDADLGDGSTFVPQGHTSFLEELFHF